MAIQCYDIKDAYSENSICCFLSRRRLLLTVSVMPGGFRTFGIRQPDVILGHLTNKVKEILAREG